MKLLPDVTGQPCLSVSIPPPDRLCRCVLQSQCARGSQPGQWLWSFDMDQQCLAVQELNPSNISKDESRMVGPRPVPPTHDVCIMTMRTILKKKKKKQKIFALWKCKSLMVGFNHS